jgi:hypothetical protein
MKKDGEFEVIAIPEAVSHLFDLLDRRVHALADCGRDPVSQKGQYIHQILAEHPDDRLAAIRAGKTQSLFMNRPHLHPFGFDVQLDPVHPRRLFNPQNMTIKIRFLHDSDPLGAILSQPFTH